MSLFSSLNSPPVVAITGAAVILGFPAVETLLATKASLAVLKGANLVAFLTNAAAVSVPGRIDEEQDQAMRKGALNPAKASSGTTNETTPLSGVTEVPTTRATNAYTTSRMRTLVNPSGWAFAIWGPIYLGEAAFVGASLFSNSSSAMAAVLPQVTAPFVAANIMQSLWCASFRPSYSVGAWQKYVSVGMLAGTAYSLSQVQSIAGSAAASSLGWYFLPMSLHFGWTTAATLVNLNGSIAMNENTSDSTVIAVGHASAVTAAALGVGIGIAQASPAYALTVGWALAACADGMNKRINGSGSNAQNSSDAMKTGANVQRILCWAGSAACVMTAAYLAMV